MRNSRVLVLVNHIPKDKENSLNYDEFQRRMQEEVGKDADITMAALKEFRFDIDVESTRVWAPHRDIDVQDFDLVVFRLWSDQPERAAAMVHYLRYKGITYTDPSTALGRGSKAACAMSRWAAGISIPATVFGTHRHLQDYMQTENAEISFPCILKSVSGRKGRDNYLIRDITGLREALQGNTDVEFMLQQFIPNTGDYRFLVFGRYIRCVIRRMHDQQSHLSNTSQGGEAELCDVKDFSREVRHDVLRVASLEGVEMAGVDVMFDETTGQHYVLEVNRSPQLLTGAFPDEKIAAFGRFIKRHSQRSTHPTRVIGRHVRVTIPEFHDLSLTSKVDTGAYRNALHAGDIVETEENGVPMLYFSVYSTDGQETRHHTTDFKSTKVRQSKGGWEPRYFIHTDLLIDGQQYYTTLTLTDRQSMRYPLLLGRRLLRDNFVVDVTITEGVF